MKIINILVTTALLFLSTAAMAGEHSSQEAGLIKLSAAQIKQAGIFTEKLQIRAALQSINAPGTVAFNAYSLADITTVVDAVVHARYVHLGEEVKKGQKLATLNSTALAQAEASYLKAQAEHHRSQQEIKRLQVLAEQKIVSQARLQQAESTYQIMQANLAAAKATLFSYGLNKRDISGLIKQKEYGLLTLRSPHDGAVIADDFRIGQHFSAGSRLMQVVDESHVWVEVKIPESQLSKIKRGQAATVILKSDGQQYSGHVINIHHQLDAATRTAGVRLEVENSADALHPGMFVQAKIAIDSASDALLLPEHAVQRQGNDNIVFVRNQDGYFVRRVVRVGTPVGGFIAVSKGLKVGEIVVVSGSFALISELMKSSFADAD